MIQLQIGSSGAGMPRIITAKHEWIGRAQRVIEVMCAQYGT